MKNKLIILTILALHILIAQEPVFNSPYLTDEMRKSTKVLLKFDEVVKTIKDSDKIEKLKKQVKFYRAASEAIYIEYNKLNNKNIEKFDKFESLIDQYIEVVGTNVNEIVLKDPPNITYEYKPMKITSTAVKKQNHKKQAKLMKKNYILMFKYYKENSSIYASYLQYLKELKESGQYKITEDLISDSVQPNSDQVVDISIESKKEDKTIVTSKSSGNIIDEPIIDSQESQVNTVELEKINEVLSYRIESLEVRIDEIEEEENKKSDGISKKVNNIEKKIKTLEQNDENVQVEIEVIKKESNDYSQRDYPEAFIDAKNNGITQFTYRGKIVYAFTRKEYKEAILDARIYGKESFEIGNEIFDSKLEYEQIKRLTQ